MCTHKQEACTLQKQEQRFPAQTQDPNLINYERMHAGAGRCIQGSPHPHVVRPLNTAALPGDKEIDRLLSTGSVPQWIQRAGFGW